MSGWDDADTAMYYEAFCLKHSRYSRANAALIAHADIETGMRVLDFAAGTGRTAQASLRRLGKNGRAMCVEPSAAMRNAGLRRITDPRIEWGSQLPDGQDSFDRILCGSAIWQIIPLIDTFRALTHLLRPGGALCFNIPAAYLLEPDDPGGGQDPSLLSLPGLLMGSQEYAPAEAPVDAAAPAPAPLSMGVIRDWLNEVGLRVESWQFRVRITQDAFAAWLKIPLITDRLLAGLTPRERAERIDAVLGAVDRSSWKWERWRGWTAWKAPTDCGLVGNLA
jgi:SAM-dependent methyltransferase